MNATKLLIVDLPLFFLLIIRWAVRLAEVGSSSTHP